MKKLLFGVLLALFAPLASAQQAATMVQPLPGSKWLTTPPSSLTAQPCTATTIGTSATLLLDSVANGTLRNGGGFNLPPTAANGLFYTWNGNSPTTSASGTVFYLPPTGSISFAGAPNSQLWAIATGSVTGSCFYD